LIAGQQILDAVGLVKGGHRADLIGKLLPAIRTLALTLGPRSVGLFCGQAALLCLAVQFLQDRAVGVEAQRFAANDAVFVEDRRQVWVAAIYRHVGQIDRLAAACQGAVRVNAIDVQQIEEGCLDLFVFGTCDDGCQRDDCAPFAVLRACPRG